MERSQGVQEDKHRNGGHLSKKKNVREKNNQLFWSKKLTPYLRCSELRTSCFWLIRKCLNIFEWKNIIWIRLEIWNRMHRFRDFWFFFYKFLFLICKFCKLPFIWTIKNACKKSYVSYFEYCQFDHSLLKYYFCIKLFL